MKKENTVEKKNILTDYRIYIGIIIVLLIIIFILLRGDKEDGPKTDESVQQPAQQEVIPEEQGNGDTPEGEAQPEEEPENKLEENTHASIERLVEKYCASIVNGDVETLETIVDELTEEEKESIRNRAKFIESFDNITCYTKDGPEENSYIVFICYDMKLINVETSAPDILCLYMPDGPDGRYIHYGDVDESMQEYVSKLEQDPDVKALFDDVRSRYQTAQENDKTLAEFVQKLNGQVTEEETEQPEEPESTEEPEGEEEQPQEEPAAEEATVQNRQTRVSSTVNVRSEASTESARLTVAYQGDTITQIESYDNGWSKVEYKGQTGYVMTEYLE